MPTTALDSPLPESSHCDGSGPACTLTAYLPPHSYSGCTAATGSRQQGSKAACNCNVQQTACNGHWATDILRVLWALWVLQVLTVSLASGRRAAAR